MSVAAHAGLDGDSATAFDGEVIPREGIFTQPSKVWDMTNTQFMHRIAGEDKKEFAITHHRDSHRYEVPADKTPDFIPFIYGEMPQTLTLRPIVSDKCCCPPREFHIARHQFGDPIGHAKVNVGQCFMLGCAEAEVEVAPVKVGGPSYKGSLKKAMCGECCNNEMTLTWDTKNKPYMTNRGISSLDTMLYECGVPFWLGWRGSSSAVPQTLMLYDASETYDCYQQCDIACSMCQLCKDRCCDVDDQAPRFARSEDLRRVVLARYDIEFACRKPAEGDEMEVGHEEGQQDPSVKRRLPRAHLVDALFTSRLYHDIICGKPNVVFGTDRDAKHEREAAIDVRYRGSRRHKVVTEDDHLIVLAGMLMYGLWMFPATAGIKAGGPMGGGPAELMRGFIRIRDGGQRMDGSYDNSQGV
jgi:hypothetical protein